MMEDAVLNEKVERLERALGTLISWMAASYNSPISHEEARRLIDILTIGEQK